MRDSGDRDAIEIGAPPDLQTDNYVAPVTPPSTVDAHRESVRGRLTLLLTAAVIGAMFLPLLIVAVVPDREEAIKSLSPLVTLIGIYGTVLGFYFSESKHRR